MPIHEGLHAVLVSTSPGGFSRLREGQVEKTKGMEILLYKQILIAGLIQFGKGKAQGR